MTKRAIALRTIIIVLAITAIHAGIFVAQMLLGAGPVGATLATPAGSAQWFREAERWVRFDSLLLWPLIVALGAVAQRIWCRRSPWWTASFIALPAVVARLDAGFPRGIVLGAAYVVIALVIGALARVAEVRASQ